MIRVTAIALLGLLLAAPSAGAVASADGLYRGRTAEGLPITLRISGQRVTLVRLDIGRYVCVPEGDIGPLAAEPTTSGRVLTRGIFGFSTGPASQRVRIDGQLARDRRTIRGSLRMTGAIGTGDPCSSRRLRFSAVRG
ncbi:unannotated protein [freshwater metagenome]|uniref:Unannotated protein n=1 Tax=freshwater metagenome TaxID=449393 RepID=A0A6J7HMK4_9ZZZZ|nr:hypothetical protein [Actinomycetota bacterium]